MLAVVLIVPGTGTLPHGAGAYVAVPTGSTATGAFAVAIELHGLAAQRHVHRHMSCSLERRGLGIGQQFAALGGSLIGMRRNDGVWLDKFVDHIGGFGRPGREHVTNVQNSQLGVEFTPDTRS